MLTVRLLIISFFFLILMVLPQQVFAETTPYRSAGWVETENFIGAPEESKYVNLTQCQATDGLYCSRANVSGGANLYLSSFGTLADFGIPSSATITKVHLRIKGKNNDYQRIYLDRGRNKNPLSQLCNNPFDLWSFYLGPFDTTREFHTTVTPFSSGGNNLGQCFTTDTINTQNYTFSIYDVESYPWSADIDNFEIAFDYTPAPTPTPTNIPTPTPTPTVIPTPTPPAPFLDLPWDYENKRNNPNRKKLTFEEVATLINSYFDHEYPFLCCSILYNLDPEVITMYENKPTNQGYSLHDGYDYGSPAQVEDGDSVLAAYSGKATLIKEEHSGGGGNEIKITHGNGYQTIYEHLYYDDNLIVKNEDEEKDVTVGQRIGTVGHTGNCWVSDGHGGKIYQTPSCAHIHFGVVQDKNGDNDFKDNMPDGLTDPYGWQSTDPDPWENYSFSYTGKQRTGNKSYYLWIKKIPNLKESLPSNGGVFHMGACVVEFPKDDTRPFLNLEMQSDSWDKISNSLVGIAPSISIVTKNLLGDTVKFYTEPIMIHIDFSQVDFSRYDWGTVTFSIYSSNDRQNWTKEQTTIDMENKTATSKVNHTTYFALMAERIDTIAPVTTVDLQGNKGKDNWFRSDVQMVLNAQDNEGGLGVKHTWYKIVGEDWQTYTTPLSFVNVGHYIIEYYSVDNDNNIEDIKTVEFNIDKTPPEAEISYDLGSFDIKVTGKDSSGSANILTQSSFLHPKFTISDQAGNTLVINTDEVKLGKQVALSVKNLQYNANPIKQIENNIYFTLVLTDSKNRTKQIDQYYSLKDDKKIFTNYLASTNTTKIYTRNPGSTTYTLETKPGIVLLKLFTQNGTLKYSY